MPLSVVEGEGFCHTLEKLEPRYQPPSRKKITMNVLPRMYSKLKDTVVINPFSGILCIDYRLLDQS